MPSFVAHGLPQHGCGIALFILVVFIGAPSGFTWLGSRFLRAWLSDPGLGSLWRLGVSAASLGIVYVYTGYDNVVGHSSGSASLRALVFVWRSLRTRRPRVVIFTAVLAVAYSALLIPGAGTRYLRTDPVIEPHPNHAADGRCDGPVWSPVWTAPSH